MTEDKLMKKILFFIHDLGQGGAEKVLVNLVNNMDLNKYEIHVKALFGGGVNEQFLNKSIKYSYVFKHSFPGNSHLLKLFSPWLLHYFFIREQYDIEISYLEGPSARIISGCNTAGTKLLCWIHSAQENMKQLSLPFRCKNEAMRSYLRFDRIVCVSNDIKKDFESVLGNYKKCEVVYNTIDTDYIQDAAKQLVTDYDFSKSFTLVAVGSLKPIKGFDRLLRVIDRLNSNGFNIRLVILGIGPQENELKQYVKTHNLENVVSFLGYKTNPYKYVSRADLFVCSSISEGFSTAITEALILGTPVCSVEVPGIYELLGNYNEYGLVVDNSEDALYIGLQELLRNPSMLENYRKQALLRGRLFLKEVTVQSVENLLEEIFYRK